MSIKAKIITAPSDLGLKHMYDDRTAMPSIIGPIRDSGIKISDYSCGIYIIFWKNALSPQGISMYVGRCRGDIIKRARADKKRKIHAQQPPPFTDMDSLFIIPVSNEDKLSEDCLAGLENEAYQMLKVAFTTLLNGNEPTTPESLDSYEKSYIEHAMKLIKEVVYPLYKPSNIETHNVNRLAVPDDANINKIITNGYCNIISVYVFRNKYPEIFDYDMASKQIIIPAGEYTMRSIFECNTIFTQWATEVRREADKNDGVINIKHRIFKKPTTIIQALYGVHVNGREVFTCVDGHDLNYIDNHPDEYTT